MPTTPFTPVRLVIAGFLICCGLFMFSLKHSNTKLTQANAVQGQQVQTLQQDANFVKKSDTITDKVVAKAAEDIRSIPEQQKVVDAQVQHQIQQITAQYGNRPQTPVLQHQKDDAISEARLQGLWKTYCNVASAPSCDQQQ